MSSPMHARGIWGPQRGEQMFQPMMYPMTMNRGMIGQNPFMSMNRMGQSPFMPPAIAQKMMAQHSPRVSVAVITPRDFYTLPVPSIIKFEIPDETEKSDEELDSRQDEPGDTIDLGPQIQPPMTTSPDPPQEPGDEKDLTPNYDNGPGTEEDGTNTEDIFENTPQPPPPSDPDVNGEPNPPSPPTDMYGEPPPPPPPGDDGVVPDLDPLRTKR